FLFVTPCVCDARLRRAASFSTSVAGRTLPIAIPFASVRLGLRLELDVSTFTALTYRLLTLETMGRARHTTNRRCQQREPAPPEREQLALWHSSTIYKKMKIKKAGFIAFPASDFEAS